jgi:hypothetical protein
LHHLAVTCAYEHCTAVLAELTLRHPELLEGAEARMQTLWRWHAAEETEHGAVSFDLYQAAGGNLVWRRRWFSYVLISFALECVGQTLINLHRDGSLWRWRTAHSAWRFALGRHGLLRLATGPLLRYYRRDFHPARHAAQRPTQGAAAACRPRSWRSSGWRATPTSTAWCAEAALAQTSTRARSQAGSSTAFCFGKSTQMVVAPPAAQTTSGWSARPAWPRSRRWCAPGRWRTCAPADPGTRAGGRNCRKR